MRTGDSGLLRNISEGAVSIVVIENIRQAVVVIWVAVGTNAVRRSFPTEAIRLKRPVDVARHKQVKLPVIVVIEEPRARAPATTFDAGFFGDIGKGSIAVVVIQDVPAVAGHI